jgi:hypothetical protein
MGAANSLYVRESIKFERGQYPLANGNPVMQGLPSGIAEHHLGRDIPDRPTCARSVVICMDAAGCSTQNKAKAAHYY